LAFALIFSGFPMSCLTYTGPHSLECVGQSWNESDCNANGRAYPGILSPFARSLLTMNLE